MEAIHIEIDVWACSGIFCLRASDGMGQNVPGAKVLNFTLLNRLQSELSTGKFAQSSLKQKILRPQRWFSGATENKWRTL